MAIQLPTITEYFSSLVQFNFCKIFLDAELLNLRNESQIVMLLMNIKCNTLLSQKTVIESHSNDFNHKTSIFQQSHISRPRQRSPSYVLRIRTGLSWRPLWKTITFQQEWAECIMGSLSQDRVPSHQPHGLTQKAVKFTVTVSPLRLNTGLKSSSEEQPPDCSKNEGSTFSLWHWEMTLNSVVESSLFR